MKKFKEGQKVICVEVSLKMTNALEYGKIYTISKCSSEHVKLQETGDSQWLIRRFKNANSELIKERLGVK